MNLEASRPEEQEIEISLVKIFQLLLRKARWIALVTILGFLLAGGGTYFLVDPVYSATATLYVSSNSGQAGPALTESGLRLSQQLVETYIVILESNTMLEKSAKQLDVEGIDAAALRHMMEAAAVNATETLRVTMRHTDPQTALKALQTLVANAPEEIGRVVKGGEVSVIDSPELSKTIDWPLKKNTALGGMIGFALSAGLVVLVGILDKTVYTAEDIMENCDLPVLGEIPDAFIGVTNKGNGGGGITYEPTYF